MSNSALGLVGHYLSRLNKFQCPTSPHPIIVISSDVTVFSDEHLHYILIYGSNVYNSVSNRLIITETITYMRNSGRFTNMEAFG